MDKDYYKRFTISEKELLLMLQCLSDMKILVELKLLLDNSSENKKLLEDVKLEIALIKEKLS